MSVELSTHFADFKVSSRMMSTDSSDDDVPINKKAAKSKAKSKSKSPVKNSSPKSKSPSTTTTTTTTTTTRKRTKILKETIKTTTTTTTKKKATGKRTRKVFDKSGQKKDTPGDVCCIYYNKFILFIHVSSFILALTHFLYIILKYNDILVF